MRPRQSHSHRRLVFVAGLHRTGTSLLARLIASHPYISCISGSPAPEDEGAYLQGGIAHTALHGRPGHYATDAAQHLIETCVYDTKETRDRMLADWSPWFDAEARWWLEKSPVNFTRMRLYQQLFPTAQFVIIVRHPEKMAAALAKWCSAEPAVLIEYGLQAYEIMLEDFKRLHWAIILRYEDLVADPQRTAAALFRFLDLPPYIVETAVRDGNADYANSAPMTDEQADRAARFGYAKAAEVRSYTPFVHHPLRDIRDELYRILPQATTRCCPARSGKSG